MNGAPLFINRQVFESALAEHYEDTGTIYGDMSRLAVAFLASTPPHLLQALYDEQGWGGNCNPRAIHEAARAWYQQHHPELLPPVIE